MFMKAFALITNAWRNIPKVSGPPTTLPLTVCVVIIGLNVYEEINFNCQSARRLGLAAYLFPCVCCCCCIVHGWQG